MFIHSYVINLHTWRCWTWIERVKVAMIRFSETPPANTFLECKAMFWRLCSWLGLLPMRQIRIEQKKFAHFQGNWATALDVVVALSRLVHISGRHLGMMCTRYMCCLSTAMTLTTYRIWKQNIQRHVWDSTPSTIRECQYPRIFLPSSYHNSFCQEVIKAAAETYPKAKGEVLPNSKARLASEDKN